MIQLAVFKGKGKPELVTGVETKPQHFTIPEDGIPKYCFTYFGQTQIAATKCTVNKFIAGYITV